MCSRGAFYGQVSSPLVLSPSGDIVQLLPVPPPHPQWGAGSRDPDLGKSRGARSAAEARSPATWSRGSHSVVLRPCPGGVTQRTGGRELLAVHGGTERPPHGPPGVCLTGLLMFGEAADPPREPR